MSRLPLYERVESVLAGDIGYCDPGGTLIQADSLEISATDPIATRIATAR
jgi:hypothetical protein